MTDQSGEAAGPPPRKVEVGCPRCPKVFLAPESRLGTQGRCSGCGQIFKMVARRQVVHLRGPEPDGFETRSALVRDDEDFDEAAAVEVTCPSCDVTALAPREALADFARCEGCGESWRLVDGALGLGAEERARIRRGARREQQVAGWLNSRIMYVLGVPALFALVVYFGHDRAIQAFKAAAPADRMRIAFVAVFVFAVVIVFVIEGLTRRPGDPPLDLGELDL